MNTKIRCMVVDDEPLAVEMLAGYVRRTPSLELMSTFTDPVLALSAINSTKPDLVFMDIQMPIMNGYDATRKIRTIENSELANVPIVAMTANALDEDVQNSLEAGMNAHLSKPINIVEMFAVMHKYIK